MAIFQPYAPEKAALSRWIVAASSVALFAYGSYELFIWSPESWRQAIGGFKPLGEDFPISWSLVAALIIFLGAAAGTWWAVNYPRLVDFFSETEVEMTKVSWSSRREVVGSSVVVIVTVVVLGLWIYIVDLVLSVPWGRLVRGVYERIFG